MKKTIVSAAMMAVSCIALAQENNEQLPQWAQRLVQSEIVDSIVNVHEKALAGTGMTNYHVYYHQPLCHDDATSEQFQLRCALLVRDDADLATYPMLIYFGGYRLGRLWEEAGNIYLDRGSRYDVYNEIAYRYDAGVLYPEYRYFGESAPEACWNKLEYLTVSEAAQDFHAIIEALKTEFHGKWAMSGTSKGGLTTTYQHAFFPEDADIYVPKSAPYFLGTADLSVLRYALNYSWTPELRENALKATREMIEDKEAIGYYKEMLLKEYPDSTDHFFRKRYYIGVLESFGTAFAYVKRDEVQHILTRNEEQKEYIVKTHGLSPSYLNALKAYSEEFDATTAWKKYLPQENQSRAGAREYHFAIDEKEWEKDPSLYPYYYQSMREMGNYSYDFHDIYPKPEYQALADSLQQDYALYEEDYCSVRYPGVKGTEYIEGLYEDLIFPKTAQAEKPIIFLYGEDDLFTGSQIDDMYINGTTVHKYILDRQHHGVAITLIDDESVRDHIWQQIDNVMKPEPTGITEMTSTEAPCQGRTYNLLGQPTTASSRGIYIRPNLLTLHGKYTNNKQHLR